MSSSTALSIPDTLPAPPSDVRARLANLQAKYNQAKRDLETARECLAEEPTTIVVSRAASIYRKIATKAYDDVAELGEEIDELEKQVPCFSCQRPCSDDDERCTTRFGAEVRYFCGASCRIEHNAGCADDGDDA